MIFSGSYITGDSGGILASTVVRGRRLIQLNLIGQLTFSVRLYVHSRPKWASALPSKFDVIDLRKKCAKVGSAHFPFPYVGRCRLESDSGRVSDTMATSSSALAETRGNATAAN